MIHWRSAIKVSTIITHGKKNYPMNIVVFCPQPPAVPLRGDARVFQPDLPPGVWSVRRRAALYSSPGGEGGWVDEGIRDFGVT